MFCPSAFFISCLLLIHRGFYGGAQVASAADTPPPFAVSLLQQTNARLDHLRIPKLLSNPLRRCLAILSLPSVPRVLESKVHRISWWTTPISPLCQWNPAAPSNSFIALDKITMGWASSFGSSHLERNHKAPFLPSSRLDRRTEVQVEEPVVFATDSSLTFSSLRSMATFKLRFEVPSHSFTPVLAFLSLNFPPRKTSWCTL